MTASQQEPTCQERVVERRWGFQSWTCGKPVKAVMKLDLARRAVCGTHKNALFRRGWSEVESR